MKCCSAISGILVPSICRSVYVLKSTHTFLCHVPGVNGKCKINEILIGFEWLISFVVPF